MSKHTEDYTVLKTTDHSIFSYLRGNRDISKSHVKWLTSEIKKDANILRYNPLLVNEKLEVIDGQHRLEAAKIVDTPVWFIIEKGLTLKDAQALNQGSKPWSPLSYAMSHSKLGNKNYDVYLAFRKEFGLNHDVLVRFLSLDLPITNEMFRSGAFEVANEAASRRLCEDLDEIADLWQQLQGKHRAYIRNFALAFKRVWEEKDFSQRKLVEKFKKIPTFKLDWGTVDDTTLALKELYSSVG